MPPLRREEQQGLLGAAVEGDGEVELAGDGDALLEQHALDALPADRHAEDRVERLLELVAVAHDAHAAGLAPAAAQHLRLDGERPAETAGRSPSLLDAAHELRRQHRDAELGEELLALVFVEVHQPAGWPRRSAPILLRVSSPSPRRRYSAERRA